MTNYNLIIAVIKYSYSLNLHVLLKSVTQLICVETDTIVIGI
jgi:hypothetical protein